MLGPAKHSNNYFDKIMMQLLSGRSDLATSGRLFLVCAAVSITAHRCASANTS